MLHVDKVSKRINNIVLFGNLTFNCPENTLTAITGPNGSGKSTLLRILLGYSPFNSGRIYLKENETETVLDRHNTVMGGVGMDFFPELKIAEIIQLYSRLKKMNQYFTEEQISNQFPLNILNNQYQNLSSGWKNKLKVFLTLMTEAKVILLDEPFSNIDKTGIESLKEIIHLVSKDRIMLIATNREEEMNLCSLKVDLTEKMQSVM
jgi:ABC-type multidrug transport system ATPase subunit